MNNYTVTVYIEISITISGITPTKLFWIKQGLIYKNLGQVHKYKMGLVQTIVIRTLSYFVITTIYIRKIDVYIKVQISIQNLKIWGLSDWPRY